MEEEIAEKKGVQEGREKKCGEGADRSLLKDVLLERGTSLTRPLLLGQHEQSDVPPAE